MKEQRIMLISDIHNCHKSWNHLSNEERMELLKTCITEAQSRHPYDAVLILGDVSLDFWICQEGGSYLWTPKVSRTAEFMEKIFPVFPKPVYICAGNHEQYGEEDWQRITGQPRQQIVPLDGAVVVLLDAFSGDLDPKVNSDGTYLPVDVGLIRQALETYPAQPVFLAAHYFDMEQESDEFRKLLREEPRIKALFCGHDHRSGVLYTDEQAGNKPILRTGNFSYSGEDDCFRAFRGWRELLLHEDGSFDSCYYVPEQIAVPYDGYSLRMEEHRQDSYHGVI